MKKSRSEGSVVCRFHEPWIFGFVEARQSSNDISWKSLSCELYCDQQEDWDLAIILGNLPEEPLPLERILLLDALFLNTLRKLYAKNPYP
jgi:hypothetical protein